MTEDETARFALMLKERIREDNGGGQEEEAAASANGGDGDQFEDRSVRG